jgi:hypothetical protein
VAAEFIGSQGLVEASSGFSTAAMTFLADGRRNRMTAYLITFDVHAMDHIPEADFPAVGAAAHGVVREIIDAGAYLFSGGTDDESASVVAPDGTVTDEPRPGAIGGITVIEVPTREEALAWAAKIAVACRCPQEVRAIGDDPELAETHRARARITSAMTS